jgi:hypothetical protein
MQIGLSLSLTAQLRLSTSAYVVSGFEPALVFDFKNGYYRKGEESTVFASAITHSASTNATMVDSDGLLKWRPHNLLTHSGDLTNANWTNNDLTVTTGQNDFEGNPTAFKLTPTTVSGFHRLYKNQVNSNLVNGMLSTVTIDLKADGYNFFSVATNNQHYAIINLSDGSVSLDTGSVSPTVTSLGNGWYRCSITSSTVFQEVFSVVETTQAISFGSQSFTGDGTSGVLVAYPHSFRSGLGGMVTNPDTASSYVPTTTTPVYLSRRGHHIYNGSAWVNEGILHESEARTNLFTDSNDFSDWGSQNITVSSNFAASPDGTTNASKLTNTASTGFHRVFRGVTVVANVSHSYSTFFKAAGETLAALSLYDGSAFVARSSIDLTTGVVSVSNGTAVSQDMGDGWYRLTVTGTPTATNLTVYTYVASLFSNTGNDSDGVLAYGAQIEEGATPSSYIPTGSASVTRAAETLTVPAANLPYDNTNMSIQIDGKITYANSGSTNTALPWRWRVDNNNIIYNRFTTSGSRTGQPQFLQGSTSSGIDSVVGTNNVYSAGTNVPFNLAGRYGSTFINGAHEGTLLTSNTTPTSLPALSSTDLELGQLFMGTIGQFRMWSDDITDAGITEAST